MKIKHYVPAKVNEAWLKGACSIARITVDSVVSVNIASNGDIAVQTSDEIIPIGNAGDDLDYILDVTVAVETPVTPKLI